jgi:hypothetical protein
VGNLNGKVEGATRDSDRAVSADLNLEGSVKVYFQDRLTRANLRDSINNEGI